MKKFTIMALCAFLFSANALFAQPTAAPTTPTKAAADVISILGNTYMPLATNFTPAVPAAALDFNPNWGQGTEFAEFPVAGNPIKKYAKLDYQGIDFGGSINASSMTTLHWDVYTDVATTIDIFLIANGAGERSVKKTTMVGWNSYDIPLTEYTSQASFPVNSIFQFKFVEDPMAYKAGTKTVYLYNIYFWKPANVPTLTGFSVPAKLVGAAPFALTAPTSPSSGAFTYMSSNTSVATISGSTVTIVGAGTSTITANQAAAGAYAAGSTSAVLTVTSPGPQTAAPTPTKLAANVTSLYSNAYTNATVDTWSAVWDNADVADVTIAGNATKKYTNHTFSGIEFTTAVIDATARTHFHLDVWTADAAGADGFKVKLVDFGANGTYQGAPNDDAESIELPFTPTASGWFSVDVPLSSFTGLTTKAHLAQMVLVTPGGGKTFWLDNVYLYNVPVTGPTAPMTAAPTPTRPAANVISMFSGAYTDLAGTNWNPGWGQATIQTDVTIAGNPTKKYENLNYQGAEPAATINATPTSFLHIDAWTANAATSFRVKLVDFGANGVYNAPGTGDDTEHELSFTLAGGSWEALDIPLGNFTTLSARAHIGQFIISSADAVSPTIWLDNIYFYSNASIPVELVNFKAKANSNTTVLTWNTASERNNAGFTIERSANGSNYTAIGTVKGNGTTSAPNAYTFTDNAPASGSNYYRLRQSDTNGKETFSAVVSVLFGKAGGLIIKSNLVRESLDITVGDAETGPLSIFNLSGQLMYSNKLQGTQRIDVSAFAAGMYIVRTASGAASRFVKQ
jgi:hypothetical protein